MVQNIQVFNITHFEILEIVSSWLQASELNWGDDLKLKDSLPGVGVRECILTKEIEGI